MTRAARAADGARFVVRRRSRFGAFALVWGEGPRSVLVHRVLLPGSDLDEVIAARFPAARRVSTAAVGRLADGIAAFLDGEPVRFALGLVNLAGCSDFQRSVLRAEHAIPRGWVSTYGAIAIHVGAARGARAVGRALATNPFPIVVPCHRALACGGRLGGYQGGLAMKRALLEAEGAVFDARGRIVGPRFFYR